MQVVNGATTLAAPAPLIPGSPEYDTAMLARAGGTALKVEGQNTVIETPAPAPQVDTDIKWPDYLPEKFRDPKLGLDGSLAKMAASYGELEKARSQQRPQAAVTAPVPAPEATALIAADKAAVDAKAVAAALPDTDPGKAAAVAAAQVATDAAAAAKVTADTAAAKAATASAGVDYDALTAEFGEKGELSAESYAKLEAAGIPKEMVDAYVAGQVAIAADIRTSAYKLAGGTEESYNSMADWMRTNVPAAEIEQYNKMVSGNKAETTLAITAMYARFIDKNGFNPQHTENGGNRNVGVAGYNSREEQKRDMKDPRYAKDEAFRAQVEAKTALTTAF